MSIADLGEVTEEKFADVKVKYNEKELSEIRTKSKEKWERKAVTAKNPKKAL